MPSVPPPNDDRHPSKKWAFGPVLADLSPKYRYPLYGFFGLFFLIALFYVFALFDPNTLFNAQKGFVATMDAVFGPNNWRAG